VSTLITDIAKAIDETDVVLNALIALHISPDTDTAAWRIVNYEDLRRWAYPDHLLFNDALVQIDNSLVTEGEAQRDAYYDACWAVRLRFPSS